MKVSDEVKAAYKSNSITKHLTLYFPEIGLEVPTEQLHSETMHLSESIFNKESIEFVGCIASKFRVNAQGIKGDIKGRKITAKISTDGTEDEPITLFNGIVDSAKKTSNKQVREIVAYDELYTKGNMDVAAWYKSLPFPVTIKAFRGSLFRYIGITQEEVSLPNDDIVIDRQYDPNTLQALSVIKAVCQINGAFGIVNRKGNFEYRILAKIDKTPYPSATLFPSNSLFPANPQVAVAVAERLSDEIQAEAFSFYKTVNYEEFEVKPVDKLTIRQSENDAGVTYGTGENNYIIQGNMFTYGLPQTTIAQMAKNVFPNVQWFTYIPFDSDNNGLPFVECGLDAISYYMVDFDAPQSYSVDSMEGSKLMNFYVLNRELSGIQALRDKYSAKGEEYQSEFITDLQTQIDVLKRDSGVNKEEVDNIITDYDFTDKFGDYTYDKGTIDSMISEAGGTGGFNVESVAALPAVTDDNTIYLIQGIVVVK